MHKQKHRSLVLALAAALVVAVAGCSGLTPEPSNPTNPPQGSSGSLQQQLASQYDAAAPVEGGYVVLSARQNGTRQVSYLVVNEGKTLVAVGAPQVVEDADGQASLQITDGMVVVQTAKNKAPQFAAFKIGTEGLEPVDYYAAIAPEPAVKEGPFLLVNKYLNVLWHYEDGRLVKAYRVATGRQTEGPAPTWEDYRTNFFTPEGTFQVTSFVLNPAYGGLKPGDQSYAGGAPGNPLGTRWMGFSVLEGDGAGIWGIHGTSEPETIGTWVSDGCIRLKTEQAEELYALIVGRNPTLQIVGR